MMNADFSSSSFTLSAHRRSARGTSSATRSTTRRRDARVTTACSRPRSWCRSAAPVREGVGLLGSPPFEIPRSVRRDAQFDDLRTGAAIARAAGPQEPREPRDDGALPRVALDLLLRLRVDHRRPCWACTQGGEILHVAAAGVALVLFTMAYFVLVERLSLGFRRLSPQYCSIYDPYYWRHERYWKLNDAAYLAPLNGTPFKGLPWRAARRPRRPPAVRRRLRDAREDTRRDRRRLHARRAHDAAVPLARGRDVQVRPHRHRLRLHDRDERLRALRRGDRTTGWSRSGLVPDEGRAAAGRIGVGAATRRAQCRAEPCASCLAHSACR